MTKSTGVGRGKGGGGRQPGAGRKPALMTLLDAAARSEDEKVLQTAVAALEATWRRARQGHVQSQIQLARLMEAVALRKAAQ